ncbi:MAG: AAA family ATPase [Coriobacteriia bacterium]|nr:AAA family ATPase [Coriobacteriia bacterium]
MKFLRASIYVKYENLENYMYERVLYEEIDKKAIVLTESAYHRRRYIATIDDEEYKRFDIFLFLHDWRINKEDCDDIVKLSAEILGIKEYKKYEIKEYSFTELYETDDGDFSCNRLIEKARVEELMAFLKPHSKFFYDWVVEQPLTKKENFALCEGTIHSENLKDELNRIYQCSKQENDINNGVPVHYILEGNNKADYQYSLEALLSSLADSNRIDPHIFKFNFDKIDTERNTPINHYSYSRFLDLLNANLGATLCGNTIVVQYGLHDNENSFSNDSYSAFTKFIEAIKPYMEHTPVIFSIPEGNSNLAKRIKKLIGLPTAVIKINDVYNAIDKSFDENFEYLKTLAKKRGLVPDRKLKEMLSESLEDQSVTEIDTVLDNWACESRITKQFPQYTTELKSQLAIKGMHEPCAMEKLNSLIGLNEIKTQIKEILARFKMNEKCKRNGLPVQNFSMHMAFLGNPGTGKTEVARLFGQILKEANVLSEGRVISVSGPSFPCKVDELFEKCKGSVLFIDEAYELFMRDEVVASLIANMEDHRDEVVCIFAGYTGRMNRLFDSNIGFRSRLGFILKFPDYSQDELLDIYKLMLNNANLKITDEALSEARDILWRGGKRIDKGNGRFVRKYFEDCLGRQQVRLSKLNKNKYTNDELTTICLSDVKANKQKDISATEKLNKLIGLNDVKEHVRKRINYMKMQKLRRDRGIKSDFVPMNMAFTGNPGTGKTEVARHIGKILAEEGVLSVGDFIECHPGDLCGPEDVDYTFQNARGSVLFIDEAYTLANLHPTVLGAFMKNMEDYREEVVVIFAGYTKEINNLLKSNPGFKSRINTTIFFKDYSIDELIEIAEFICKEKYYKINKIAKNKIIEILKTATKKTDFGNARFVRNLIDTAIVNQSDRLMKVDKSLSDVELQKLKACDFEIDSAQNEKINEFDKKPYGFTVAA